MIKLDDAVLKKAIELAIEEIIKEEGNVVKYLITKIAKRVYIKLQLESQLEEVNDFYRRLHHRIGKVIRNLDRFEIIKINPVWFRIKRKDETEEQESQYIIGMSEMIMTLKPYVELAIEEIVKQEGNIVQDFILKVARRVYESQQSMLEKYEFYYVYNAVRKAMRELDRFEVIKIRNPSWFMIKYRENKSMAILSKIEGLKPNIESAIEEIIQKEGLIVKHLPLKVALIVYETSEHFVELYSLADVYHTVSEELTKLDKFEISKINDKLFQIKIVDVAREEDIDNPFRFFIQRTKNLIPLEIIKLLDKLSKEEQIILIAILRTIENREKYHFSF